MRNKSVMDTEAGAPVHATNMYILIAICYIISLAFHLQTGVLTN